MVVVEERTRCPVSAPWAGKVGLGVLPLPFKYFGEPLLSQVLVPQLGEVLVLAVKLGVIAVAAVLNEAAPLLDSDVVIAPAPC